MDVGQPPLAPREAAAAPLPGPATARKALISIALLALTVATFADVRGHRFVALDDLGGIQHNPDLAPATLAASLRNAFTKPLLSNWIPITALSHQLDRRLHGQDAGRHLLTNLALHAGSSLLLFWALAGMTGALGRSAFVAAVFAVHPLHVETVAWISERKGVLSGFFFALSLWVYAAYAARPTLRRLLAVLAALSLALLSKPTTVTLPCVFLLLDFWPLQRLGRRALLEKLPMLPLVAGVSIATFLVQRATGAMTYGEAIPLALRLENALSAYGFYLGRTFWPTGLAPFYVYPRGGPGLLAVALGAAALGLGTTVALWQRAARPYLLVGWLWFVGMLVPTLGLVQVGEQPRADRYTYLPLIGLSIALTWAFADLVRAAPVRRVAGVSAVALLAFASWRQVDSWRDDASMWQRVLEVNPGSARARIGLGSMHARRLEFEEAERIFAELYASEDAEDREIARKALLSYHLTRASYLRKRGDAEGVVASYREAIRYADAGDIRARRGLGLSLAAARRGEEARPYLEGVLAAAPGDVPVLLALASVAQEGGRSAEAVELRREILRIAPTAANANDLAWLLATAPEREVRDPAEALRLAEHLVAGREDPPAYLLDTLAASYASAGRFDEAVATVDRALAQAERLGDAPFADALRRRQALYRAGRPLVASDRAPPDLQAAPRRERSGIAPGSAP